MPSTFVGLAAIGALSLVGCGHVAAKGSGAPVHAIEAAREQAAYARHLDRLEAKVLRLEASVATLQAALRASLDARAQLRAPERMSVERWQPQQASIREVPPSPSLTEAPP